jgi:hypothetical protein
MSKRIDRTGQTYGQHLARPLAELAEFVKMKTKDGKPSVFCPQPS